MDIVGRERYGGEAAGSGGGGEGSEPDRRLRPLFARGAQTALPEQHEQRLVGEKRTDGRAASISATPPGWPTASAVNSGNSN
jgi:hypothetical protein